MSEGCVIGRGIEVKGTLSGGEDLIVEGRVEGEIRLDKHITVMESGEIKANISTYSLEAHGKVSGQIDAQDLVSLSSKADVHADIRAPRVVIEDGAHFNGRIEMDVNLPAGL